MTEFTNAYEAREFMDQVIESEGLEPGEAIYIMRKGSSYIVTTDYDAAEALGYKWYTVCRNWD